MTTAHEILQAAQQHMQDRAKKYDNPKGERSMKATVSAFNVVTDSTMTEEQGWLFMALLKAVRSQQGDHDIDSFEDGAAYLALAGECASKQATSEDDGWIKWDGSNPYGPDLDENQQVKVRERRGGKFKIGHPKDLSWRHVGLGSDIVAYKVLK